MTQQGTNTYLLGRDQIVVIDPGPDLPAHRDAILAALQPGATIVAILLTHAHADHVGGLAALQAVCGAPSLGFGPVGSGRSAAMQALVAAGAAPKGEGFAARYAPDRLLADGQILDFDGFAVEVLHTPGHTGCSLSFAVADDVFTGDLAMGWASSLIAPPDGDMTQYMTSLARLSARPWARLLPGHGAAVTEPALRLAELAAHRRTRETEILAALTLGLTDIAAITASVYRDTPSALRPMAALNVLAHLIDLTGRGLIRATPHPGMTARFTPA